MLETKHTFCRICEASCGLVADMENGKIVDLRPNKDHIGTDGFACMKGLNQHKMYDSPDRLQYPLKRVGDRFERISWSQAISEIGAKTKALRKVSANAISMYVGTAAGFSLLHPIFAEGFMKGIGSHNVYSSSTQDCANRFASATEMYGFPFHQPIVDLDHVKYMLIIGTNPVVSKWTFMQVAHPVKRLKEVRKRGGKQRDGGKQHERACVSVRQQRSAAATERRAEEGRHDSAGEDERDRARAEPLVRNLGRCEAIELGEALVGADQQRPDAENEKRPRKQPEGGN